MRRLEIQFLDQGFHRVLFDAIPLPAFVVDREMRIFDCNAAAARMMGRNRRFLIHRRGGEVLNCVHAAESLEGCGHAPACRDCLIRESVGSASRTHRAVRRWTEMELVRKGRRAKTRFRVNCQPFTYGRSTFVLLVLEGLSN